jgi:hypothetical protein
MKTLPDKGWFIPPDVRSAGDRAGRATTDYERQRILAEPLAGSEKIVQRKSKGRREIPFDGDFRTAEERRWL